MTQRNLDKFLLSVSPPWKISLTLMLKPSNNLRDILMTIEKNILQLLRWIALKVHHCAIKPKTAKGYKTPEPQPESSGFGC